MQLKPDRITILLITKRLIYEQRLTILDLRSNFVLNTKKQNQKYF